MGRFAGRNYNAAIDRWLEFKQYFKDMLEELNEDVFNNEGKIVDIVMIANYIPDGPELLRSSWPNVIALETKYGFIAVLPYTVDSCFIVKEHSPSGYVSWTIAYYQEPEVIEYTVGAYGSKLLRT
jgi:hypothetical protein